MFGRIFSSPVIPQQGQFGRSVGAAPVVATVDVYVAAGDTVTSDHVGWTSFLEFTMLPGVMYIIDSWFSFVASVAFGQSDFRLDGPGDLEHGIGWGLNLRNAPNFTPQASSWGLQFTDPNNYIPDLVNCGHVTGWLSSATGGTLRLQVKRTVNDGATVTVEEGSWLTVRPEPDVDTDVLVADIVTDTTEVTVFTVVVPPNATRIIRAVVGVSTTNAPFGAGQAIEAHALAAGDVLHFMPGWEGAHEDRTGPNPQPARLGTRQSVTNFFRRRNIIRPLIHKHLIVAGPGGATVTLSINRDATGSGDVTVHEDSVLYVHEPLPADLIVDWVSPVTSTTSPAVALTIPYAASTGYVLDGSFPGYQDSTLRNVTLFLDDDVGADFLAMIGFADGIHLAGDLITVPHRTSTPEYTPGAGGGVISTGVNTPRGPMLAAMRRPGPAINMSLMMQRVGASGSATMIAGRWVHREVANIIAFP